MPFDDQVEDSRDRKARFEQREKFLIEDQEVLLSNPAPGGEGGTEGKVGTTGSNPKDIVAFRLELVP